MGSLNDIEQKKLSYFHALGKLMTDNQQAIYESKYKSAHNVSASDIWASDVAYSATNSDAINESIINTAVTYHDKVKVDMIPGSNGQAFVFVLNGSIKDESYPANERGKLTTGASIVSGWISPVDILSPIDFEPSVGYTARLFKGDGTEIFLTDGAWSVDYNAGVIHFSENYTPSDLGWGDIKASFFQFTGDYVKERIEKIESIISLDDSYNILLEGDLDMKQHHIIINEPPILDEHAANKGYVDSVAKGLKPHPPVKVVATNQIVSLFGIITIDGFLLSIDDRVLLTNQGNTGNDDSHIQNGVWIVKVDAWVRPDDMNGSLSNELSLGDYVLVEEGITNSLTGWVLVGSDGDDDNNIDPDVENQTWVKTSAQGTYTADGNGIVIDGTVFKLKLDNTTLTKTSLGLKVSDSVMTRISNEETIRETTDESLTNRISIEESKGLLIEESLEGRISTDILTETTNRSDADTSLETRISTEISNLSDADTSLEGIISTEILVRETNDADLSTDISTEKSTRIDIDGSLETRFSTDILTEETTRSTADLSLKTRLTTEETTRSSADASLTVRLSIEENFRSTSDITINSIISTEKSNMITGDESLTVRLSIEENDRSLENVNISNDLLTELTTRSSADLSLETRISTELLVRATDDNTLTNDLSTEVDTRSSADLSLETRVSNDLSVEASIRSSVDDTLLSITNYTTVYNETINATVVGNIIDSIVNDTLFVFSTGTIDLESINISLNGVNYPFSITNSEGIIFHTNGVTPIAETPTTLYFDATSTGANFILETDDNIHINYTTFK